MADRYVRSLGAGSGVWATVDATLKIAVEAATAGDYIFVAADHAETGAAALSMVATGTAAAPLIILCADNTVTTRPVSSGLRTTATITTTGTSNISIDGHAYCYGITFNVGTSTGLGSFVVGSANQGWVFKNCSIKLKNTNASSRITLGIANASINARVEWDNVVVNFANASQAIALNNVRFKWKNTASATTGTVPTNLFIGTTAGIAEVEGVDLSAISTNLVLSNSAKLVHFKDCKLHASATLSAVPNSQGGAQVVVTRCDSEATNYKHSKGPCYEGSQVVETTITRTNGASDGTQAVSWLLTATANAKTITPFESLPIAAWNDNTGVSVTATIEGIWTDAGSAVPKKEDIWVEFEYLGSAASPVGSFVSSGNADVLATADCTTGTATWNSSPATPVKFKCTVSFTPQQKGFVYARVYVGKASAVYYIDPMLVLS